MPRISSGFSIAKEQIIGPSAPANLTPKKMARLSTIQALELLKTKRNQELNEAEQEEKRARFYTEPVLTLSQVSDAKEEFSLWVKNIIDPVKYSVFETLNILPIATVEVTDGIFKELQKVFNAQDRYIGYELASEDMTVDMREYLKSIGDDDYWKTKGFNAMKNRYNSFVIIDMPPAGSDTSTNGPTTRFNNLPRPYYYILPVEYVIAVEQNHYTSNLEYIAFKDMYNSRIAYVFDDLYFRVYKLDDRGEYQQLGGDIPHELGMPPACKFWNDQSSLDCRIRSVGLISGSLGKLKKLLFNLIGKDHADLYVKWPITVSYKQKCTYEDGEGNPCQDGFISRPMRSGMDPDAPLVPSDPVVCPICNGGKNKWFGAGTHIQAPGRASNDEPDMLDGVRFVSADVTSLEHIQKDLDRDISWLTYNMIGITDEMRKQAVNEMQVQGSFESRQVVLDQVAGCFEKVHRFVLNAIGVLRYGRKQFKGSTVNYGRKFFLHTVTEMADQYVKAKSSGMPAYELANQRSQIYETKYQNNPEMRQRNAILDNLEPYQDYTTAELISMRDVLDRRLVMLKSNFDQYIKRFEREYTNVVSFMQFSNFDTKIDIISEKLMSYVDEAIMLNQTPSENGNQQDKGDPGARPNPPADGGTPPPADE
jgi:hypothetical protein